MEYDYVRWMGTFRTPYSDTGGGIRGEGYGEECTRGSVETQGKKEEKRSN